MRNDKEVSVVKGQPEFPKSRAEELIRENSALSGSLRWQPLHGDGSERTFYRVATQKESLILIWSPPGDETFPNENDSYVCIGRHLRQKGVPVPEILGYYRSEGLTLVEDLGSVHLQDLVVSGTERLTALYGQAIDVLLEMQVRATEDLETRHCFDTPLYDPQFIIERELEYFRWSFLEGALGLEIDSHYVEKDFSLLASLAGEGEGQLFFLHRDFQSRNLMVKGDHLYLIDFQGARLGPPQYDLAALLLDPYVQLPGAIQQELLTAYSRAFGKLTGGSVDELLQKYPHVALCRNLQVLAAFSFLTRIKGRSHFAQYIVPAWKRLRQQLAEPPCSDYRTLADVVQSQNDETVAEVAARLEREVQRTEGRGDTVTRRDGE
jgi:aminoglycoside/choline kinase family phosphotransferase